MLHDHSLGANTYPFVDVHLQGFVVRRKQVAVRTFCLIADGELEQRTHICRAEINLLRGDWGTAAETLTTSLLVRPWKASAKTATTNTLMRKDTKSAMDASMKKYLLASFTSFLLERSTSLDWHNADAFRGC